MFKIFFYCVSPKVHLNQVSKNGNQVSLQVFFWSGIQLIDTSSPFARNLHALSKKNVPKMGHQILRVFKGHFVVNKCPIKTRSSQWSVNTTTQHQKSMKSYQLLLCLKSSPPSIFFPWHWKPPPPKTIFS